jgi:hypothetical protein
VEGTRARSCRRAVAKTSSIWVDLALAIGAPIVPVRFAGGLPVEEAPERLEFPLGYGRQDYLLGRPILPAELADLPFAGRRRKIVDAVNHLGTRPEDEVPLPADDDFAARVRARAAASRMRTESAVVLATLSDLVDAGPEARAVVDASARSAGGWLGRFAAWLYDERGIDGGSSGSRSRV